MSLWLSQYLYIDFSKVLYKSPINQWWNFLQTKCILDFFFNFKIFYWDIIIKIQPTNGSDNSFYTIQVISWNAWSGRDSKPYPPKNMEKYMKYRPWTVVGSNGMDFLVCSVDIKSILFRTFGTLHVLLLFN